MSENFNKEPKTEQAASSAVETIVIGLKEKIKKLYVKKISSSHLSEDERELATAVYNDAISLVIDQLDGKLVDELS